MAIKKFYRGSTTFKCNVCRRGTRDTGVQSAGNKICPQCFELAGIENEISDGYCTLADMLSRIRGYVAEVAAKGGDVSEWKETFGLGKDSMTNSLNMTA